MKNKLEKAILTHNLDEETIIELLSTGIYDDLLFKAADSVRKQYKGDVVHIRGLIEFSNICKQNCKYCGIRRDCKNIDRYRLDKEQILSAAHQAVLKGIKTVVLQSGEDAYFTTDKMAEIISALKKLDLAVTLSSGEKSTEEYRALKEAGADRYLLRIETTDRTLYEKMHPNMSIDNRLRCLWDLKKLGYETGTGCLVGLPGQSPESLARDILFFKELDADMVGLGPFIPAPETPLAGEKGGSFELALKVMALTRLLMPDINIPATTAMEALHPQGRTLALNCGANVVMPNISGCNYSNKYALYPGKSRLTVSPVQTIDYAEKIIQNAGRKTGTTKGFRNE